MAVDLHKDDGEKDPRTPGQEVAATQPAQAALPAQTSERGGSSVEVHDGSSGGVLPAPMLNIIRAGLPALWIVMFAIGQWQIALVLLFITGPVIAALGGGWGGHRGRDRHGRPELRDRRRDRALGQRDHELEQRDQQDRALEQGDPHRSDPAGPAPSASPSTGPTTSAAERSLAATVVRAETSRSRLDDDALGLIRDVDQLLRPLLAHVRARGADAAVRHDLEGIATEHLPAALDAYLLLPTAYAHEHRTVSGTTPADELRSQLTLLVEGCRQLRDAVHDADLDRQQELSRFLAAKFQRSELDLG